MSIELVLIVFFVLASLPWFTERAFVFYRLENTKSILMRLIELITYYLAALMIAIGAEIEFAGDVYQQGWEFFVTTFCLFCVFAVPGVVYRYQWLSMNEKERRA
jgi:hypothetical protein